MLTSRAAGAGEPYWLTTPPPASWPVSSAPDLPATADVVIAGGGIIGLCAALWAARMGASTVLLEEGSLTCGATGRNIGVMLFGGPLDRADLLQQVCHEENLAERPRRTGHLSLLDSADLVQAVRAEQRIRPSHVELLSRARCEELLGTAISARYLAGRWAPHAMVVNPVLFARGIAAAAAGRGARFFAGQKVDEIRPSGSGPVVVAGEKAVRARAVVIAAAHGAAGLVPGLDSVLRSHRARVSRSTPAPAAFAPAMAVNFGDLYWRQVDDGTILLGGLASADPGGSLAAPARQDGRPAAALTEFFRVSFPELPEMGLAGSWSGVMMRTPDGRPIISPVPGLADVWLMSGFDGHGLSPALMATMKGITAMLRNDGPSRQELIPYALTRFPAFGSLTRS
jgi:glycine/D-amino acid oxidase-like deaminating enzyme